MIMSHESWINVCRWFDNKKKQRIKKKKHPCMCDNIYKYNQIIDEYRYRIAVMLWTISIFSDWNIFFCFILVIFAVYFKQNICSRLSIVCVLLVIETRNQPNRIRWTNNFGIHARVNIKHKSRFMWNRNRKKT